MAVHRECTTFADEIATKTTTDMSKEALINLRNYIQLTLSAEDLQWLFDELAPLPAQQDLKPYTLEEMRAMVEEGERDIAAGHYYTTEELLRPLFEEAGMDYDAELARAESLQYEAV